MTLPLTENRKWRVSKYIDDLREVELRSAADSPFNVYEYFDTKAEARAFIVARAEKGVATAETYVKTARARLARVRKKFGALKAVEVEP